MKGEWFMRRMVILTGLILFLGAFAFIQDASAERFVSINGMILDNETHLMWAGQDNGSNVDWNTAQSYLHGIQRRRVFRLADADRKRAESFIQRRWIQPDFRWGGSHLGIRWMFVRFVFRDHDRISRQRRQQLSAAKFENVSGSSGKVGCDPE